MPSSYKSLIAPIVLLLVIVFLGAAKGSAQSIPAACPDGSKLFGWAWSSSGPSHVSFNSQNPDGGGGVTHCVSIDSTGNLVGWAWSSHIGWIRFGGFTSFPTVSGAATGQNAKVSGNTIVGWARACEGLAATTCSGGRAYPAWDGWVELSGTNHTMSYENNRITGYAWGGEVVGWLEFDLTVDAPEVVQVSSCSISYSGNYTPYTLSWNSQNANACTGTNFDAGTPGTSGTISVSPSSDTTYSLNCTPQAPAVNNSSCSVTISTPQSPPPDDGGGGGCSTPPCTGGTDEPGINMWLDNDANEKKSSMVIRQRQSASINWEPAAGEGYTLCLGTITNGTNTTDVEDYSDDDFGDQPRPNGNAYIVKNLDVGTNYFEMQCRPISDPDSTVEGKIKDTTITTLKIQVVDPTLEEI